jgi:glutathione S-transferase
LDDGRFVCEITTICEYLEELQPSPALVGTTPEERAETRMWTRRIDLNICEPMTNAFRAAEGRPIFEKRIMLVGPSGAEELKAIAKDRLKWFGDQMGDRQFVCGDRLTMADILLYCFLTFGAAVGQPLATEHAWTAAWIKRMDARPSAKA